MFSSITFSRLSIEISFSYELAGNELVKIKNINNLCIIHHKKFNFYAHLEASSLKAHSSLFFMNLAVEFISPNTKKFINKEMIKNIKSHFTYCCQSWFSHLATRKKIVESAEHSFLRNYSSRFST